MSDIQPACYGIRRKGQVAYIGMVPAKIATTRPTSEEYREKYEERGLYDQSVIDDLLGQVAAAKEEAFAALSLLSRMRFSCGDNGTRMQDELEEYLAGLRRDAERLDWLKPGFRFLAGQHAEQVMWPDPHGKVTQLATVPAGVGVRAAIDAAMAAERGEG